MPSVSRPQESDELSEIRAALADILQKNPPSLDPDVVYYVKTTIEGTQTVLPPIFPLEKAIYSVLGLHMANLSTPEAIEIMVNLIRGLPDPYAFFTNRVSFTNCYSQEVTTRLYREPNDRFINKMPRQPFFMLTLLHWKTGVDYKRKRYFPLGTRLTLEESNLLAKSTYDQAVLDNDAEVAKGTAASWLHDGKYFFGRVLDKANQHWIVILHQHFVVQANGELMELIDTELDGEGRILQKANEEMKQE